MAILAYISPHSSQGGKFPLCGFFSLCFRYQSCKREGVKFESKLKLGLFDNLVLISAQSLKKALSLKRFASLKILVL